MAHVYPLVAQAELHLRGEFQQPEEVGDGGTFLADALRQPLLGQFILVDELSECQGYFYCVEVFALDVLDEGHLGQLGLVGGADIGGD